MSVKQCWLWGIIGSIIIAAIIMFAADALAHGEGECLTDAVGNVPLPNGGWVKVVDHLEGSDLDGYKHGHLNQYFGKNGKTTKKTTEFYDIEFGDFFASCPTAPPSPSTPITSTPTTSTTPEPVRVSTPTRARVRASTRASTVSRSSRVTEEVIEKIVEDANNQADKPVPKLESSYYRCEAAKAFYAVEFQSGLDFHAPKVMPAGVSTIAGLWERYHWVSESGGAFYILHAGIWFAYRGEYENVGNLPIHPHTALVIEFNGETFRELIRGCVVADWDSLRLNQGMNLVGLPNQREDYAVPSDFLEDGVSVVIVERNGQFYSIAQIGDAGDEALQAGDAVLLFNSIVSAAPSVRRKGTLATSWGAMKR
jgi:hypothetical protein